MGEKRDEGREWTWRKEEGTKGTKERGEEKQRDLSLTYRCESQARLC